MSRDYTRRRALGALAGLAAGGLAGGRSVVGRASAAGGRADGFEPVRHGFGFRNWGRGSRYFEPAAVPTREALRERVRTGWRETARETIGLSPGDLPAAATDAIVDHLRTALEQGAGTNGHCYGMALTAQRYFERPDAIPVARSSASEIRDPTEPSPAGDAPVYREIVERQVEQFLRFRSWIARLAILRPAWLDVQAVLRDVRAVVAATGTASVVLFDGSLSAHQVLVHRITESDGETRLHLYDPNEAAPAYDRHQPTVTFVHGTDGPRMRPYGGYSGLLYTRYDQIERATDRTRADPTDHLAVGADAVRDALFPLLQVAVDTDDVVLKVAAADGAALGRVGGRLAARSRGRTPGIRTRYGVEPGRYRVTVVARRDAEFTLSGVVADRDAVPLDVRLSDEVAAGEVRRYSLVVPPGDEAASLAPADREGAGPDPWVAVGAGVGVAAGVLGARTLDRVRSR
ncbi:hypothetical protein [Halobaculum lipolyticum]|uniref:Peptidase C39-like domain-containing protein n=1 Tax=Halobaculum lipolyticum TaxID=3032001 RepID=A0ABD5W5P7_9EURY|nr:hypothetical protein [Halobaculum sp. DT31]